MLPRANHKPPSLFELRVVSSVSLSVGLDLSTPPVAIRLRNGAVLRTPMPEAAVHLNSDPGSGERHVRCAREPSEVDPIPEASAMELAPDGKLWPGGGSSLPGHEHGDASARSSWALGCFGVGGHR